MFKKLFQSLKGGSSEKTGSTVAADPVTYKDVTIIATPTVSYTHLTLPTTPYV